MWKVEDLENCILEVIMQEKISLYLEYEENASFWYDINIFLTFWTIVRK